jgi:MerR family transcriptional regulator, light-induced transcriptional regulator
MHRGAMSDRIFRIQEVTELTGLEPARLRAWERRYAVVRPVRSANGYRAYSEEQVALLSAYARLIEGGARIGDLAERPAEEVIARATGRSLPASPHAAILEAVKALDRERLEAMVAGEIRRSGLPAFARDVAPVLAQTIGELWALGRLPVAAEHVASEVVVRALKEGLAPGRRRGPLVVAACLPDERHEWGVTAAMVLVQELGWRCHYLGPDLPVAELGEAAWALRPAAVAVSGSTPEVVRRSLPELAALATRLPPGVAAVAGGGGTGPHRDLLTGFGWRTGLEAFQHRTDAESGARSVIPAPELLD